MRIYKTVCNTGTFDECFQQQLKYLNGPTSSQDVNDFHKLVYTHKMCHDWEQKSLYICYTPLTSWFFILQIKDWIMPNKQFKVLGGKTIYQKNWKWPPPLVL